MGKMKDAFAPLDEKANSTHTGADKQTNDEGEVITPVPEKECLYTPTHWELGDASKVWDYKDRNGNTLMRVCRFIAQDGTKQDRPLTWRKYKNGTMRWAWKGLPTPRPLYGLDRLAARPDAPVLVCEGEKATDAAQSLFHDYVAITSPNGAGSPHCADWKPIAGRAITIFPDHDEAGKKYANIH